MSFDYRAPAEIFLAKRTKNGPANYWRFATRLMQSNAIRRHLLRFANDVPAGTMAMVSSTDFCERPKGRPRLQH